MYCWQKYFLLVMMNSLSSNNPTLSWCDFNHLKSSKGNSTKTCSLIQWPKCNQSFLSTTNFKSQCINEWKIASWFFMQQFSSAIMKWVKWIVVHSVEITEIYSHSFLARISWKQHCYYRNYKIVDSQLSFWDINKGLRYKFSLNRFSFFHQSKKSIY